MDKKIVLITGAGKGIGKATVKKFLTLKPQNLR